MSSAEAATMRQLIIDCALEHDLTVDAIYVDDAETVPAELSSLVTAILGAEERFLIIPNLLHLAGLGDPYETRASFESNGIQVLVARR